MGRWLNMDTVFNWSYSIWRCVYSDWMMEEETGFHEKLESVIKDIHVYWTKPSKNRDMSKALGGEYYRVVGIPTYLIRKRKLGIYLNNNFELVKFVNEEEAHVRLEVEGSTYYGLFQGICTTEERGIIREARERWQNDLLADINLDL